MPFRRLMVLGQLAGEEKSANKKKQQWQDGNRHSDRTGEEFSAYDSLCGLETSPVNAGDRKTGLFTKRGY